MKHLTCQTLARTCAASLAALWTLSGHAHDGHGLTGGHWHASDAGGFAALAVLVAVGVWASRKDR